MKLKFIANKPSGYCLCYRVEPGNGIIHSVSDMPVRPIRKITDYEANVIVRSIVEELGAMPKSIVIGFCRVSDAGSNSCDMTDVKTAVLLS